jgi:hypothetical protein
MKEQFILNGKNVVIPEFTFNTVVQLEEMGISLAEFGKSTLRFVRAVIAVALDVSEKEAGIAIDKYVIDGGDLTELFEVVSQSVVDSGFIKALTSNKE